MKKTLLIISMLYTSQTIAAPYLTTRQENIIKAVVSADYENAKNSNHSMIFDNKQELTPNLIGIASSQIVDLGKTGVESIDWYSLNKEKAILIGQYRWILFASIATSYSSPNWVCEQYDDACIDFVRNDNFPEIKLLSSEEEKELDDLAGKQLKEIGIEFKYRN